MKSILVSMLFAASAFADVTINDSGRVLKDGSDIGAVADAVKNNVVTPTEVQAAIVAAFNKLKTDKDNAATEKAAVEAARLELIASTKAALADKDAAKAKADAAAVIATAEAPQKEKELMALEQQKADIQAKIDALNASAVKKFLPKLKANTAPKKK